MVQEAIEALKDLPEDRQVTVARAILDFASEDGVYHLSDYDRRLRLVWPSTTHNHDAHPRQGSHPEWAETASRVPVSESEQEPGAR